MYEIIRVFTVSDERAAQDTRSTGREQVMATADPKRDAILTAAVEVFANYGFRKTTVGDIIRAAGVSRGTVYKHFEDKSDIFEAVIEREMLELLAGNREAVERETTTRARLRAGILSHIDGTRRKINILRVMREAFAEVTPHQTERMQKLMREGVALFRDTLELGVEEGDIVVDDLDATALALMHAVKGLFISAVMDAWDERREVIVDGVLDLLMDGLRPREAAAR